MRLREAAGGKLDRAPQGRSGDPENTNFWVTAFSQIPVLMFAVLDSPGGFRWDSLFGAVDSFASLELF